MIYHDLSFFKSFFREIPVFFLGGGNPFLDEFASGEYDHLLNDDIGAEEDMGKTGSSGWIVLYNLYGFV